MLPHLNLRRVLDYSNTKHIFMTSILRMLDRINKWFRSYTWKKLKKLKVLEESSHGKQAKINIEKLSSLKSQISFQEVTTNCKQQSRIQIFQSTNIYLFSLMNLCILLLLAIIHSSFFLNLIIRVVNDPNSSRSKAGSKSAQKFFDQLKICSWLESFDFELARLISNRFRASSLRFRANLN